MQASTVTVANIYESIVDAEVVVNGQTVNLHTREGAQLGTLTQGGTASPTALYTQCTTSFTPLVLPVDYMP